MVVDKQTSIYLTLAISLLCSGASEARGGRGAPQSASPPTQATSSSRIATCWSQPQVSASTSEAPPNYGIVLSLEPNNGIEISADTYLLNSNMQKVKQVGHAEVTQQTDSASDTVLSVLSSSDSPSQFSFLITLADPTNPTSLQGALSTAVLFTGDAVSNQMFTCKLATK